MLTQKKDGIAIADFLIGQGYRVYDLYDEEATRTNIMTIIGEEIAPRLTEHDRVVVFFSGHGTTMTICNEDFGYVIPMMAPPITGRGSP